MVIGAIVLQLFLEALVLGFLVRRVAAYNATTDFFNMMVVVGGALFGGVFIEWGLTDSIGPGTLLVQALLLIVLLIKFSGTNPLQAGIVTVLFFAVKVLVQLALLRVFSTT